MSRLRLHVDADRVVVARHVQRPDVQRDDAGDHERQQVVQREEAVERRVVDREAAAQQLRSGVADDRDGREDVGDHGRAPEAHLAPGQHVAHEGGRHHQQEDEHAEDPEDLARRLVGAEIQAAEDVDVDGDEEHRGADGVDVAWIMRPPLTSRRMCSTESKAMRDVRRVVHGQDDAGDDLDHQASRQDGAEGPPVVEVLRRRDSPSGVLWRTG